MNPIIQEILRQVDMVLQFSDEDATLLIYKIVSKTVSAEKVITRKKSIKI